MILFRIGRRVTGGQAVPRLVLQSGTRHLSDAGFNYSEQATRRQLLQQRCYLQRCRNYTQQHHTAIG